jgi:uncharacterized protein (DUF697 family)
MEKEQTERDSTAEQNEISKVIRNHVMGSMGVGLIPLPLLDLAALMGIQLNMLRRLANSYNIPFSKDKGKNVLASLIGAGISLPIATTLSSLVKAVPLIGQAAGALSLPATAGASTYAVAKVFTQHFASGGTFLDFDPEKVKAYYFEMLKEGEKIASELKEQEKQAEEKAETDPDEKTQAEISVAEDPPKEEIALADTMPEPENAVEAEGTEADSEKKSESMFSSAAVRKDESKAEDSTVVYSASGEGGIDGNDAEESMGTNADGSIENEETAGAFRSKRGKKAKKKG